MTLLTSAAAAVDRAGAPGWRAALVELETHWLAPAVAGLRAGRIGMLTLIALGGGSALSVEVTRTDLRYWWRRRRPLASYLAQVGA